MNEITKQLLPDELTAFQPFEIKHSTPMKAFMPVATLGFLALGLFLIYLGIESISEKRIFGGILIPVGSWMTYLSYLGYDLIKYGSHVVTVRPDGFTIGTKFETKEYEWKDVTIKARDGYQVLEIFDTSKKKILAIDYLIPKIKDFILLLKLHTEPIAAGQRR